MRLAAHRRQESQEWLGHPWPDPQGLGYEFGRTEREDPALAGRFKRTDCRWSRRSRAVVLADVPTALKLARRGLPRRRACAGLPPMSKRDVLKLEGWRARLERAARQAGLALTDLSFVEPTTASHCRADEYERWAGAGGGAARRRRRADRKTGRYRSIRPAGSRAKAIPSARQASRCTPSRHAAHGRVPPIGEDAAEAASSCMCRHRAMSCMAVWRASRRLCADGWPLALDPAGRSLTVAGRSCRSAFRRRRARPAPPAPAPSLVFHQLGNGEAVGRSRRRSREREPGAGERALPGVRAASVEHVALRPSAGSPRMLAARKATALPSLSAVGTSASTNGGGSAETNEQSVRLSGPATRGFFSLSVRQNSLGEVLADLAHRIADAILVSSWRRCAPAHRTGRPSAGNRARRSGRRCRRSRRRSRTPRAR